MLGPVLAEAREITERVRQARAGCEARTVRVECALGDATVRGVLVVHGRAQVTFRFSKLDGHVAWRLRTWVAHLLGCASGESIETMAELRDGEERLAHIAPTQAREILSALVAFYRTGCTRRVPFFPETSSAWADAMRRGAAPDAARAIEEARKAWRGQRWGPGGDMRGERDDPFNTIVWRGEEPFGSEFEEAARMVWDPWLTASREEEKGRQQQQ